jgi:hypothetical protein
MDRLPTEQEQRQAYTALTRARDRLEQLAWRVEGICEVDPGVETHAVTLADIGLVAVLADDADDCGAQLQEFAGRLRSSIGGLQAHRETAEMTISTAQERLT